MALKIQCIFCILSALICMVATQKCGITGATNTTIILPTLNETTQADFLFWSSPTFNVTASAAVVNPHNKYIRGLRYLTKYEYVTEPIFSTFVQEERLLSFQRDVIFTCNDGSKVTYHFIVPVEDENTESPKFSQQSYNVSVSLSSPSEEPVNINILVNDADVHLKNANLFIRSSNPYVTLFINPLWSNDEIPEVYSYRTEFIINTNFLDVGDYEIILTADDGKSSAYTFLHLNILP